MTDGNGTAKRLRSLLRPIELTEVAVIAASFANMPMLAALFIVPVSPANSYPSRSSDAFISGMRLMPFDTPSVPNSFPGVAFNARTPEFGRLSALDADSGRDHVPESWGALGFRDNGPRRSLGRQIDLEGFKVNSKVVLTDSDWHTNTPIRKSGWQTEESVKLPFFGPLFVVGQLGANSASVELQQYKFIGKTGLGMKLPDWLGGEIQIRTGRSKTNYDSDTETLLATDQVKTFVEVSTRWPLAGWLNFEYTGEALPPALSAIDRDTLKFKQDVRLAVPLSNAGQFHVGAKYNWADAAAPTPWFDRMKMYIGLEFKR